MTNDVRANDSGGAGGPTSLLNALERLRNALGRAEEETLSDLQAISAATREIVERQQYAAAESESLIKAVSPVDFGRTRGQLADQLLRQPLRDLARLSPLGEIQNAFARYYAVVKDLEPVQPATVESSGPYVLASIDARSAGALTRWIAGLRKSPRDVPFRAALTVAGSRAQSYSQRAEAKLLTAVAQYARLVPEVWAAVRTRIDSSVAAAAPEPTAPRDCREALLALAGDVERAEDEFRASAKWMRDAIDAQLLAAVAFARTPAHKVDSRSLEQHLDHWAVQSAMLSDEFNLELNEETAEIGLVELVAETVASLDVERQKLLQEVETIGELLDSSDTATAAARDLPPATTSIIPAVARSRAIGASVAELVSVLPEASRLTRTITAEPARLVSHVDTTPRQLMQTAFGHVGQPTFDAVFADAQRAHVGAVQQLERARQVVEFAAERGFDESDDAAEREALINARGLVKGLREGVPGAGEDPQGALLAAVTSVLLRNRALLTQGRLGRLTQLGRLGARRSAAAFIAASVPATVAGLRWSSQQTVGLIRRFLVAIQWLPEASKAGEASVVRRPYLPDAFIQDPSHDVLPAIYHRLFRFEAVTDPRFLVGRDAEMAAIKEARALWESARPVAIAVVGARGSGKTSLINCALAGPLDGLPVIRGQFSERASTAAEVGRYLASLAGVEDVAKLENKLAAERHVVVLEETERTFIRDVNGFDGIRELQRLIAATSRTTLWIVATNRHAFRFLSATIKLADSFSHRIDATSADRQALQDAIMVRHNLSGLHLRFEAPPTSADTSRLERLRRRIAGGEDPEAAFFADLARESNGVFRSAFQFWLTQIGRVQAGTMMMRPVVRPDIDAVIDELDRDDLFTLVAIMQHGSIMASEHARIFHCPLQSSQRQIDELEARELIEKDPGHPGHRVRPRALRVVGEALHRSNLG